MAGSSRALARLSLSMRSMIQTAGNCFQARSWTTPCRAPAMFRPSLSQPTTCLRRPTRWASRVRVRLAPSVPRRRSSTLSSMHSTIVLNCATSICQRHRTVYGKCSPEYTKGTPWYFRASGPSADHQRTSIARGQVTCRRTDYQHVGRLQELIEPLRYSNPVHPLICPAMPVDGVHPHADAVHQPPGRGSDAAKAKDSADPASEHAVLRELVKLAKFDVFVLQDQALGGGKCHRQRVLSHRLGVAAAVGCHWHPLRELA